MRQLKRFALACILIASLSVIVMAGETQGPGSPAPGETSCPPGEGNAPPCFTQDPGEMNAPPGETQGPGSSMADLIVAWFEDRKSTRLNCSDSPISYADFCLKKKMTNST